MSNDLVKANTKTLRDLMGRDEVKAQLIAALPKNFSVDRFIRTAITLYQTAPGLAECEPTSVLVSAIRAAELGLELSSPLGQAFLVPFKNNKRGGIKEAQLQIGWRGLVSLAYRSNRVQYITTRKVHEKDHFRYEYGTAHYIEHRPYEGDGDPGKVTHYYCILATTTGGRDFEVMTPAQTQAHRMRFSKMPNGPAWRDNFDSMSMKTVCRKVCQRAPMVAELCEAANEDDHIEQGLIPARRNPLTGDIIEGYLASPPDDEEGGYPEEGGDAPAEAPAESAQQRMKRSRTEQLTEKVGAGREPGAEG